MKKRIKTKWVRALLSSLYKQGKSQLKTEDGKFCCLGVLCDLWVKETKEATWDEHNCLMGYSAQLPAEVIEWAGLNSIDPKVKDGHGKERYLSALNDHGWNFKRIAAKIQEQY